MTEPSTTQDVCEHFARCIQVLGGTTASARRLGIDERAIRRFINAERPIGSRLLEDTAKALRLLSADAIAAAEHIAVLLDARSDDPMPQ